MIPRIIYRKYFVASVVLTVIILAIVHGKGQSGNLTTSSNNNKQNSNPEEPENVDAPSSYGENIQNLIAGAETNNKIWSALTDGEDSIGSKLYDYLFTDSTSEDGYKKQNTDEFGSEFHKPTIDDSLSFKNFIYDLFEKVFELKPDCPDLKNFYRKNSDGEIIKVPTSGMDDIGNPNKQIYSIEYLKSIINIPEDDVLELATKHSKFAKFVKALKLPFDFYKPKSSGIVYVGGGKFTWFALLSIQNVRKTGSNLPIELFIPTEDEYEYVVCEEILPKMNAKCVLMYEFLKDPVDGSRQIFGNAEFKGFTYKSLALLLSSFENILLLDADNVPYYNPDLLFISEPYTSHKFILWPDYWQRSTSPFFYDIAGIDLFKLNEQEYSSKDQIESRIPLHKLQGTIPNPSTESGQLLISKSAHWDVLLLSLYYNIYGPKQYYHLFSQGAAGQGDKETFLAAATVLKSNFYQVTSKVSAIGYFKKTGGSYRGTAQGQKSPMEDYQVYQVKQQLKKYYKGLKDEDISGDPAVNKVIRKFAYDEELSDEETSLLHMFNNIKQPSVFFIHESTPKLDPIKLIHDAEFINDEITDPITGEPARIRFYANYITNKENYKFEKLQMDYIYEYLCERKLIIRFIEEQITGLYLDKGREFDVVEFCGKLEEQIKWLDGIVFEN
ncbi:hypothetical protein DASC09_047530 [Saccharomycopsis crataegensis]|uniref:Alpha-1,2-mannosyltransferase n=1 Tax=Saccharomycopsis crataegensis TaxID=43959 RepID=A0AAV5QR89_9ASCO|nr:hypothetical protein DASC09_047530 [Saccharomycopsis crataegensis]